LRPCIRNECRAFFFYGGFLPESCLKNVYLTAIIFPVLFKLMCQKAHRRFVNLLIFSAVDVYLHVNDKDAIAKS